MYTVNTVRSGPTLMLACVAGWRASIRACATLTTFAASSHSEQSSILFISTTIWTPCFSDITTATTTVTDWRPAAAPTVTLRSCRQLLLFCRLLLPVLLICWCCLLCSQFSASRIVIPLILYHNSHIKRCLTHSLLQLSHQTCRCLGVHQ